MLVQRFEPQGRCFTNFHYYYYCCYRALCYYFSYCRKLPSKNSLLEWVQTFQDESEREEWSCSKCTLLNPANQSNCSACLNTRNSQPMAAPHEQPTQPTGTPELASVTQTKRKLHAELPSAVKNECKKLKTEVGKSLSPQTHFRQGKQTGGNDHGSGTSPGDQFSKIPACRGHGIQCAMRQTFKDNENKGRWFFSCAAAPARKRCNYFQVGTFYWLLVIQVY